MGKINILTRPLLLLAQFFNKGRKYFLANIINNAVNLVIYKKLLRRLLHPVITLRQYNFRLYTISRLNYILSLSLIIGIFLLLAPNTIYSQTKKSDNPAATSFTQGMYAFNKGDYVSAIFMLRRAITFPENNNGDTYYMLITAEMASEDYDNAFKDCVTFIKSFYDSPYLPYILYHKGRCLFFQKQYEKCIIQLSDFCHEYPKNELYAAALFWIGESFFVNYNYSDALSLYTRVVTEYPGDSKAVIAQYRIETIEQLRREEKLLHLLKETGEEYLAAREEYEKQARLIANDKAQDAKLQIDELQAQVDALQSTVKKLQKENDVLKLMVKGDVKGAAKLQEDQKSSDDATNAAGNSNTTSSKKRASSKKSNTSSTNDSRSNGELVNDLHQKAQKAKDLLNGK